MKEAAGARKPDEELGRQDLRQPLMADKESKSINSSVLSPEAAALVRDLTWNDTFFDGLTLDGDLIAVFDFDVEKVEQEKRRILCFTLALVVLFVLFATTNLLFLNDYVTMVMFLVVYVGVLHCIVRWIYIITSSSHLAVTTEGIVVHQSDLVRA